MYDHNPLQHLVGFYPLSIRIDPSSECMRYIDNGEKEVNVGTTMYLSNHLVTEAVT